MSKVYLEREGWPDKLLGRVEENGRVYRSDLGPDDRIGRVDLDSGEIYKTKTGPDKYVGRVDLDDGKVYRHIPAAKDEYVVPGADL